MREAACAPGGGPIVMACVSRWIACSDAPQWLISQFIARRARVTDAHVVTWDDEEAFGRPWPSGTRLKSVRLRKRVKARIHHEVFSLVQADLSRSVNRILFDEVGELRSVALSGSVVERLYYESVHEGALNVVVWRDAARSGTQPIPNRGEIERTELPST